ncbi:MAG TPA: hypothetical protein PLZ36_08405, partial [Armatimonadota bacterium]|nr:hypothetical protein [Armatimonadota bacterium]
MRFWSAGLSLLLLLCGLTAVAQQGKPLHTFTLREIFGVTHPRQIVDFDLPAPVDARSSYLLDAENVEVPYQLLEGGKRLAVQTDLPAGTTRTWSLYGGRAPKAAAGLTVVKTPDYYEIVGDLAGVRIPVPPATLAPTPAPVAGIRLRDGAWTGAGAALSLPAKAMTVTFTERGPLKVVAAVRYTFDRPEKRAYDGRPLIPAGEGVYTSTITVELGQPSVMFEEESDCDLSYSLNLTEGLQPTQARYRGHHANSKAAGYEADGRQYRQWHERPGLDAFVDFAYDVPRRYPKLAIWDPWITDSGWYWQFYHDKAPEAANLCGIFAGRASRAYRTTWSGVNLFTAPQGVTDLTTQTDAAGNLHAVYHSGDELWYVRFDPALVPGAPVKVAAGLVNPDLLVREDGGVLVAACAAGSNAVMLAERGANGAFTVKPAAFVDGETLKVSQPYVYQASSGGTDYLFLFGGMQETAGGLLFSRRRGAAAFTLRETVRQAAGHRQVARPIFTRLPDGGVGLLFTRDQYVETAWIAPGGEHFAGTATQQRLFNNEKTRLLNFGAALDALTGAAVVGDNRGTLTYLGTDGTIITSPPLTSANHHGQGPNRRTAAMAADGTVLAVHNDTVFLLANGAWSAFAPGNALKLVGARVHYSKAANQFTLIGRKDGMLTAYTWKPGEAAPQLARQLPETDRRAMGLTITLERGHDHPAGRNLWTDRVRFAWGLFTGTKADLADPYQIQPIARQMNVHAGINLTKISRIQLDYPDTKAGYGSPFMPRTAVAAMIETLQADRRGPHGGGFHQYLFNTEPGSRELVTMWADPTGQQNSKAVTGVLETATALLNAFVNRDGIYEMATHYWHGGLAMNRIGIWGDQALASPFTAPEDRAKVKAALALFGDILWDDDFVPLSVSAGVNLGTEN